MAEDGPVGGFLCLWDTPHPNLPPAGEGITKEHTGRGEAHGQMADTGSTERYRSGGADGQFGTVDVHGVGGPQGGRR